MKIFKENKIFTSIYLIWSFVHLFLYIKAYDFCASFGDVSLASRYYCSNDFYPFERSNVLCYDHTELFVYVFSPLIIFIIYKLFLGSKQ